MLCYLKFSYFAWGFHVNAFNILQILLCIFYLAPGCISTSLRLFVKGFDAEKVSLEEGGSSTAARKPERTFTQEAILLSFCFGGIQIFYLTWGVLQEKIMTKVRR